MFRTPVAAVLAIVLLVGGCTGSRPFVLGDSAGRNGDWDTAVEFYRQAVQEQPDRIEYQIALERAMLNASRRHLELARALEDDGRLEDALREYRRGSEFDPPNRQIAATVLELEQRIRGEYEATRPGTSIDIIRQQAQVQSLPQLSLLSDLPLTATYSDASVREILLSLGEAAGINVAFEGDYQDRSDSLQLRDVSFEEALTLVLTSNELFYKVVNPRTIMVIPDTQDKRAQYEEQVIQTFYVSHVDVTELAQMINQVVRLPTMAVQPQIAPNPSSNTITARASAAVMSIIDKMIAANDNPKAEVVIDVSILEVNRARAREIGVDLSRFSIGAAFSPTIDPNALGAGDSNAFNLNALSRGISTSDFYLSVPSAVVRFLETDQETQLVAKPQLRGAEGETITLELGDDIPVPTTVFTPLAQGGANFNPLTSFEYRAVGVIIEMTPRVTFEGEIILDLVVENSTLGQDINIAGQNLPSFGKRRVETRIRLRDGESNLLAGLLREDERLQFRGMPGLSKVPILNRLFGSDERVVQQTDIVMLLTPHIVRTHELTAENVNPLFIGTQQKIGLATPRPPAVEVGQVAAPVEALVPANGAPTREPQPDAPASALGPTDGRIVLTPPVAAFFLGAGPYTVPLSIVGGSNVSAVSLTVTFDPATVRVQAVHEGTFMRSGGTPAAFTHQLDSERGRLDMAIVRPGAPVGAAGSGLLAAFVMEPLRLGPVAFTVTGAGTSPTGEPLTFQFEVSPAATVQ